MGDPHDPDRYGETWDRTRIARYMPAIRALRPHGAFSGGWAWHFMSPPGHVEYRHGHDHKDIDVFVPYEQLDKAVRKLHDIGYSRVQTGYDSERFRRFENKLHDLETPQLLRIDLFMGAEPARCARLGTDVIAPKRILEFYDQGRHGSGECLAARRARSILRQGDDPVGHPELNNFEEYMGSRAK